MQRLRRRVEGKLEKVRKAQRGDTRQWCAAQDPSKLTAVLKAPELPPSAPPEPHKEPALPDTGGPEARPLASGSKIEEREERQPVQAEQPSPVSSTTLRRREERRQQRQAKCQ